MCLPCNLDSATLTNEPGQAQQTITETRHNVFEATRLQFLNNTDLSYVELLSQAYNILYEVLSPYDHELEKKHQGLLTFDAYVLTILKSSQQDIDDWMFIFKHLATRWLVSSEVVVVNVG